MSRRDLSKLADEVFADAFDIPRQDADEDRKRKKVEEQPTEAESIVTKVLLTQLRPEIYVGKTRIPGPDQA